MSQKRSSYVSRICCCCCSCAEHVVEAGRFRFHRSLHTLLPPAGQHGQATKRKMKTRERTTNHGEKNRLSHSAEQGVFGNADMRSPPPDTVPTCTPTRAQADDATALRVEDSESVFCTQVALHEDGTDQPGAYRKGGVGLTIFQNYLTSAAKFQNPSQQD